MEKHDFSQLNEIPGLRFMPVKENKMPILKGWQTSTDVHDLSDCSHIGLVCGIPSGNLEVIDIDEKYSLDGQLYVKYKKAIHETDPLLLKKLVVQKTKNGGYHFIYRCSTIGGNSKLANRPTTDREKKETYDKTFQAELTNEKNKSGEEGAKKVAEKAYNNDKVRVLLETRGVGGQIVCDPSPGYKILHGDWYSVCEITPEEREILFSVARQFNEILEEVSSPKQPAGTKRIDGLSPFDDYNERGDVVALLENNGWKIVGNKGGKTIFLRPGQTTSHTSGNYDHSKKWFSVFTTSSEFEPEKAYLPYAVYAVLECAGNFSEASKKLYDLGFGDRYEQKNKTEKESTRVVKSRIDPNVEDYSFLAVEGDYSDYIHRVKTGTLEMGLTTGCPSLDEHWMFKKAEFVMTNGIDNTGKTVFFWWLLMIAAMYHGWKGVIFSSENTVGSFIRKMVQFYWGKPLYGQYAMTEDEYKVAHDFVSKHFKIIKAQEDLYNYKDIMNMVRLTRKLGEFDYAMVDPYNSLKIDLSGFSKLNTHEYHYEALSELKAYGQQTKFGWFINHHAVTAAARTKDSEKKYPAAPHKADTEGGQKIANKAGDFLTIHRITQHPTDWMVTEIHVRKIKETDTGGRPTSIDMPVKFEMYKGGCAFKERLEMGGNPIDPIVEWQKKQGNYIQAELLPGVMWKPYSDDNDDIEAPF